MEYQSILFTTVSRRWQSTFCKINMYLKSFDDDILQSKSLGRISFVSEFQEVVFCNNVRSPTRAEMKLYRQIISHRCNCSSWSSGRVGLHSFQFSIPPCDRWRKNCVHVTSLLVWIVLFLALSNERSIVCPFLWGSIFVIFQKWGSVMTSTSGNWTRIRFTSNWRSVMLLSLKLVSCCALSQSLSLIPTSQTSSENLTNAFSGRSGFCSVDTSESVDSRTRLTLGYSVTFTVSNYFHFQISYR